MAPGWRGQRYACPNREHASRQMLRELSMTP